MIEESPVLELVQEYLPDARLRGTGRNINASCPFHADRHPSFSMHTETGLWICGSCGKSGGLARFLELMGMPERTIQLRTRDIQPEIDEFKQAQAWQYKHRFLLGDPFKAEQLLPEGILGLFYKKPLDLVRAGFDPKVLHAHEVGFDTLNRRITFPIRDLYGNLTAISGRSIDATNNPKYLVYGRGQKRKVYGESVYFPGPFGAEFDRTFPTYEPDNRRCVWNAHRIEARRRNGENVEEVIVAEGFKVALWAIQHLHPNVVATMGARVTSMQIDILKHLADGRVVLLFDNDPAGLAATRHVGKKLVFLGVDTWVMFLPPDVPQADRMGPQELTRAYQAQKEWIRWHLE